MMTKNRIYELNELVEILVTGDICSYDAAHTMAMMDATGRFGMDQDGNLQNVKGFDPETCLISVKLMLHTMGYSVEAGIINVWRFTASVLDNLGSAESEDHDDIP